MVRKDGGDIPDELKRTSQQDVMFIADFIQRFNVPQPTSKNGGVSHVYLEKVGQYLAEDDLTQPPDNRNNLWNQLLEKHPELLDVPFILPVNTKTSAVKEFNLLSDAVDKIFSGMNLDVTNQSELQMNLELSARSCPPESIDEAEDKIKPGLKAAQLSEPDFLQGGVSWESGRILYWEVDTRTGRNCRGAWLTANPNTVIVDFSFYTKETLSVLLESGSQQQILVQVPIPEFSSSLVQIPINSSIIPPNLPENSIIEVGGRASCRELENIRACQFAVSGPRKVSVLLFTNRKRQRIYDMEVEEEEDEDEAFNSSVLSGSTEQTSQY
eukprot:TRINITY_DN12579_c0_g1_i1.p1 TRINITY_DN12579_c0_g1~~TRINITY_DN12579_c0_g1_i1.p1  ORF type:complete len:326 (+),score=63.13 TRINITY_DN12579_c0_g1_i1:1-978(+)